MNKLFKLKIESGKLKVGFKSHCEDERSEDAAIQTKSIESLRAKASRLTKVGFTLAEVLITLVIIGVVAAITVPMLMNDTNDKQWNVARQKAQATIGEAFRLATINGEISASDTDTNTAEKFVKNVLPKYLKIAKSCATATECGFSSKVKRPDGTEMTLPEKYSDTTLTKVMDITAQPTTAGSWGTLTDYTGPDEPYYFQTLDGFSVKLFYNPNCAVDYKDRFILSDSAGYFVQLPVDVACFNATYDMNGSKGPNQVGKDIGFVGSFYNGYESKAVTALPYKEDKNIKDPINGDYLLTAVNYCNTLHENDWVLPDVNELSLLYLNNMLIRGVKSQGRWFWSRSQAGKFTFYGANFDSNYAGRRDWVNRKTPAEYYYVRCVRSTNLK